MHRMTKFASSLLALAFVGMQFVPTATKPSGQPTSGVHMAQMIDPRVGAIFDRSCQDCHSTNARLPWYGRVAPVSWMVTRDVSRGLQKLDFSAWGERPHSDNERTEICDAVFDQSMPPRAYTLVHRNARLSPQEIDLICDWAAATPAPPALKAEKPQTTDTHSLRGQ